MRKTSLAPYLLTARNELEDQIRAIDANDVTQIMRPYPRSLKPEWPVGNSKRTAYLVIAYALQGSQ